MRIRRRNRRLRVWLALALAAAALWAALHALENNILPVASAMAEARVRAMALKAVHDALREQLDSVPQYAAIVAVQRDETGRVSMVQADSVLLNDLAARTALSAQDRIAQMGTQGIGIPLGTLLGSPLLSGRGPLLYIRVMPVGAVSTAFTTEFEEAGINQTRLRILLDATTTVRIVMPGGGQKVDVAARLPVTEAIIVGDVPNSYVQVEDLDDAQVKDVVGD